VEKIPNTIGPGHPVYWEIVEFLYHEAELLDTGRFRDWLGLMTEDLSYRMPVRVTRVGRKNNDYSDEMEIFSDDFSSMRLRVDRLATDSAWAEDPPSRTRHMISNIRVKATESPAEVEVYSYFLVYRNRGSSPTAEIFSGERQDLLKKVSAEWRLARRTIFLDQAVVGARNVAIFF